LALVDSVDSALIVAYLSSSRVILICCRDSSRNGKVLRGDAGSRPFAISHQRTRADLSKKREPSEGLKLRRLKPRHRDGNGELEKLLFSPTIFSPVCGPSIGR
jgi:hypothetical protein